MDRRIGGAHPASRSRGAVSAILGRLKNLTLLVVVLALWQFTSVYVLSETTRVLLPSPIAIFKAAGELIASGDLLRNTLASLRREFMAFLYASVAIPLGLAMGWWKPFNNQVDPLMEILRPIPPLAWIPLSILWFGIGDTQNEFIIFLGIFFPILLNTVTGVKSIDNSLIRAGRSLGANQSAMLRRIVFMAALPQIVTGVRVGLGIGWMALVAAELVGASSGLGFLINDARTTLRTDYIIVGMLTIGIVGLLIDFGIRSSMRWLLPWSQAMAK